MRKLETLLVASAFVLAFFTVQTVFCQTLYVAPSGSDTTGDGSYTWELWRDLLNHYYFCGQGTGNTTLIATVTAVLPGQQACP